MTRANDPTTSPSPRNVAESAGNVTANPTAARGGTVAASPELSGNAARGTASAAGDPPSDLVNKMRDALKDAMSNALELSEQSLDEFADYFAPRMARQAILSASPDQNIANTARQNVKHLRAQAIADAGRYGVQLQQRFELALSAVIQAVISAAIVAL